MIRRRANYFGIKRGRRLRPSADLSGEYWISEATFDNKKSEVQRHVGFKGASVEGVRVGEYQT